MHQVAERSGCNWLPAIVSYGFSVCQTGSLTRRCCNLSPSAQMWASLRTFYPNRWKGVVDMCHHQNQKADVVMKMSGRRQDTIRLNLAPATWILTASRWPFLEKTSFIPSSLTYHYLKPPLCMFTGLNGPLSISGFWVLWKVVSSAAEILQLEKAEWKHTACVPLHGMVFFLSWFAKFRKKAMPSQVLRFLSADTLIPKTKLRRKRLLLSWGKKCLSDLHSFSLQDSHQVQEELQATPHPQWNEEAILSWH